MSSIQIASSEVTTLALLAGFNALSFYIFNEARLLPKKLGLFCSFIWAGVVVALSIFAITHAVNSTEPRNSTSFIPIILFSLMLLLKAILGLLKNWSRRNVDELPYRIIAKQLPDKILRMATNQRIESKLKVGTFVYDTDKNETYVKTLNGAWVTPGEWFEIQDNENNTHPTYLKLLFCLTLAAVGLLFMFWNWQT